MGSTSLSLYYHLVSSRSVPELTGDVVGGHAYGPQDKMQYFGSHLSEVGSFICGYRGSSLALRPPGYPFAVLQTAHQFQLAKL